MNIWSTKEGGGQLTVGWDFAQRKVQTYQSFCAGGECLYSVIDPGFRAPDQSAAPPSLFSVTGGATIGIEIVASDPGVTVRIDGAPLRQPGDDAILGTAPEIHSHPSWQLTVPEGVRGDFLLSFKVTAGAPYSESEPLTVTLTNLPTPTVDLPSQTATPTVTPVPQPRCPGDCNDDGAVAINELVAGVNEALGASSSCAAFDLNDDGDISIAELVAAVNAALSGCPMSATPTATLPATLATIQREIFSPKCALPFCHDTTSRAGGLALVTASAFADLVGVPPTIDTARAAGLLRVSAGLPENSFLLRKLTGPPPDQGSRMPLTGEPLSDAEIRLVREWIAAGAQP